MKINEINEGLSELLFGTPASDSKRIKNIEAILQNPDSILTWEQRLELVLELRRAKGEMTSPEDLKKQSQNIRGEKGPDKGDPADNDIFTLQNWRDYQKMKDQLRLSQPEQRTGVRSK